MQTQSVETMTIGRLAKAANVGIETIRYYQERSLLPVPEREGSYRQYPVALVDRLRFIRRAQDLGFSLDEIGTLLTLQNGANRKAIRAIASARIEQIDSKLADLKRMRRTLGHLLEECEHAGPDVPCPIIESIVAPAKKS
jgi:MerR family mercuric resistance operon transcriptional regulator